MFPRTFAEALEAEITELLRLEALIVPPTNLQSCHRDLWASITELLNPPLRVAHLEEMLDTIASIR